MLGIRQFLPTALMKFRDYNHGLPILLNYVIDAVPTIQTRQIGVIIREPLNIQQSVAAWTIDLDRYHCVAFRIDLRSRSTSASAHAGFVSQSPTRAFAAQAWTLARCVGLTAPRRQARPCSRSMAG